MIHHDFKYTTGLNVDTVPFNPSGECKPGGLYYSREDILYFLSFGPYIAEVEIPEDAEVYEETTNISGIKSSYTKWKANKIILKERELITGKVIKRLIEEGAEPRVSDDFPLWWANSYGTEDMIDALMEAGASMDCEFDEEEDYDEEEDEDEEGVGEFDDVEEDEVPDII